MSSQVVTAAGSILHLNLVYAGDWMHMCILAANYVTKCTVPLKIWWLKQAAAHHAAMVCRTFALRLGKIHKLTVGLLTASESDCAQLA